MWRSISNEKDWLFGRTSDTSSGDSLKGGNTENCDSMGGPCRGSGWPYSTSGLTHIRGICCSDSTQSSRIWRHAAVAGAGRLQIESPLFCEQNRKRRAVVPI